MVERVCPEQDGDDIVSHGLREGYDLPLADLNLRVTQAYETTYSRQPTLCRVGISLLSGVWSSSKAKHC